MSTQLNYEVFGTSTEGPVIVLPNILKDRLGPCGDHGYRASVIANETGHRVLAYERYGTGANPTADPLSPMAYADHISTVAKALGDITDAECGEDTPWVLAGASIGGQEATHLAITTPDRTVGLAVFDPTGTRQGAFWPSALGWARHQLKEADRPPQHKNHNPNRARQSLGVPAELLALYKEAIVYQRLWRSETTTRGLQTLATNRKYFGIHVLAMFPEHSFTSPRYGFTLGNTQHPLGNAYSPRSGFQAEYLPGHWHSWTDDPHHMTRIAARVINTART